MDFYSTKKVITNLCVNRYIQQFVSVKRSHNVISSSVLVKIPHFDLKLCVKLTITYSTMASFDSQNKILYRKGPINLIQWIVTFDYIAVWTIQSINKGKHLFRLFKLQKNDKMWIRFKWSMTFVIFIRLFSPQLVCDVLLFAL